MNDKFLSIEDKVEEDAAQMEKMKIMMNAMQQQVVENYRTFWPKWIFFTQVDHLLSTNCFSKQAMNHADFFTLKIWTQSDHWLKS